MPENVARLLERARAGETVTIPPAGWGHWYPETSETVEID